MSDDVEKAERLSKLRTAENRLGKKGSFVPGKYGAWYEERMREREEEKSRPVGDRPGNWRSVANGDFSEEEIRDLERKYRADIRRPSKVPAK